MSSIKFPDWMIAGASDSEEGYDEELVREQELMDQYEEMFGRIDFMYDACFCYVCADHIQDLEWCLKHHKRMKKLHRPWIINV